MNDNAITGLRRRLAARLRQVLGNPAVEAKELAAFDLLMSRRQFLKASQYTAIAGLVAAGTPPTLWGRRDPELHVDRAAVGLTAADESTVTVPTQVWAGTELFKEPVHATPVVSPTEPGTHAVIEGVRGRVKFQSDLTSASPQEADFLDSGYHYGPPELVQLEPVSTGGYELVHYRYPWLAADDGAATSGLVREVLPNSGDMREPTQVSTITATWSNQFDTSASAEEASIAAAYLAVVVDLADVWVWYGYGSASVTPGEPRPAHPVEWKMLPVGAIEIPGQTFDDGPVVRVTKYTDLGYAQSGEWTPPVERIVVYRADTVQLFEVTAPSANGLPTLAITQMTYPDGGSSASWGLVYADATTFSMLQTSIETPAQNGTNNYTMQPSVAQITEAASANGSVTLDGVDVELSTYAASKWSVTSTGAKQIPDEEQPPQFADIADTYRLYSVQDDDGAHVDAVHLARFDERIALYTMRTGTFRLAGVFPLQLPDAAGINRPTTLSGGVSKFDGLRLVSTDTDGNLFMLRQRRLSPDDGTHPYQPPIYAMNDASGERVSSYSSTVPASPPDGMDPGVASSIDKWASATTQNPDSSDPTSVLANNILLNAVAAFAAEEQCLSQGAWLGNQFQAAYAPTRYGLDSAHIAVKQTQSSSTTENTYGSYLMFCNPVTKAWHTRLIAAQTEPKPPGENETGPLYQVTLSFANAYDQIVQPVTAASDAAVGDGQSSDASTLSIEVRADSPTTVTETSSNLYYDVDRYTSFAAAPDSASGQLTLVVKADTFAQVLYVRLLDAVNLTPSDADSALFAADSDATTYPWQAVNIAAEAQQRMGNDGANAAVDLLGDNAPLQDNTVYVDGDNLTASMTGSGSWQQDGQAWPFKSGFSEFTANIGTNLSTYLNTSGQNLLGASSPPNLAASDGGQIDPLSSTTPLTGTTLVATNSTQLAYGTDAGIGPAPSGAVPGDELGSVWSSLAHSLQDALHWLQHAATETIDAIGDATVTVEQTVDQISATVSADIMKQVNGVEQAVTSVVDTVEEYATVLANVVGTIVSDIEAIIKAIIELIEMFFHLEDIIKLTKSFVQLFNDMANNTNGQGFPLLPIDELDGLFEYVSNALDSWFDDVTGADLSEVTQRPVQPSSQFSTFLSHPFSKKAMGKVVNGTTTSPDQQGLDGGSSLITFNFELENLLINDLINDFRAYLTEMEAVVTTSADALTSDGEATAEYIANHLDNPQDVVEHLFTLFAPIADDLAKLVEEFLEDLLTFVESVVNDAGNVALELVTTTDPFMTINPSAIADFWKLLGVGSVGSDNKLGVTVSETIFLPIATLSWVVYYVATGNSATTTGEIWAPLTQQSESSANVAGDDDTWNAIVASAIVLFGGFQIFEWATAAGSGQQGTSPTLFMSYFLSLLEQTVETIGATVEAAEDPAGDAAIFNLVFDYFSFLMDVVSTIVTLPILSVADGVGVASGLDGLQAMMALVEIGVDASDIGSSSSDKAVYAGGVILDLIGPGELIAGEVQDNPEVLSGIGFFFILLNTIGTLVQYIGEDDVDNPDPDGHGPGRAPPGQRRRPVVPPGLRNRTSLPPGQRPRPATPPGQQRRGDTPPRRRGREDA